MTESRCTVKTLPEKTRTGIIGISAACLVLALAHLRIVLLVSRQSLWYWKRVGRVCVCAIKLIQDEVFDRLLVS